MSRPIAPDLAPSPSRAFELADPPPKACQGCGANPPHGSVGVELTCLREELRRARRKLREVKCPRCALNLLACSCEGQR